MSQGLRHGCGAQLRTGHALVLRFCSLTRQVTDSGDLRTALNTLDSVFKLDTTALHDPRLLFALRQQEFVELLRQRTPESTVAALSALSHCRALCAVLQHVPMRRARPLRACQQAHPPRLRPAAAQSACGRSWRPWP